MPASTSLLVHLAGELLARAGSLSSGYADRVPDRLVAGTPSKPAEVGTSTLIGMGTQLIEADERCTFVAYLVDARSGAPMRVRRVVDDPGFTAADRLRSGLTGGAPLPAWGGGQVLAPGGRRFGHGDFSPSRRVTALPGAALEKLPPPFLVGDLAGLAAQQTRLPATLDDRSAGSGLAACRFVGVRDVGFDAAGHAVRATLVDAAGATATLAHAWAPRQGGALGATAALLAGWGDAEFYVSGMWRWTREGPLVNPLLLQRGDVSLQPHVAAPAGDPVTPVDAEEQELTSPAALLRDLDQALGETLVAGWDRVSRRPERWAGFASRSGGVGASRLSGLARAIVDGDAPLEALLDLAVVSVFAHPLSG